MTDHLKRLKAAQTLMGMSLLVVLGASCGPDPGDVTKDDLVHSWEADEYEFSDFGDPVRKVEIVGKGGAATTTFRANGTYHSTVTLVDQQIEDGTWEQVGAHQLNLTKAGATVPIVFEALIFEVYGGTVLILSSEGVRFDFGEGEVPAALLARFHQK